MNNRHTKKYTSVFLLSIFITQLVFPTISLALTGGPSQPEVESFEPATTNQLVDNFTGDFTYNLPLLTVPGPNGGYPINMAYHSGIGMEEEASWVGLGWNLNVGAINRSLRGIPDDFNGEIITRKQNSRPQWGLSLNFPIDFGGNVEVFGAEFESLQTTINYDNYKGIGLKLVYNNLQIHKSEEQEKQGAATSGDAELPDKPEPLKSMVQKLKKKILRTPLERDAESIKEKPKVYSGRNFTSLLNHYAHVSAMPVAATPLHGGSALFEISKWSNPSTEGVTWFQDWSGRGSFFSRQIPLEERTRELPAYGFMYAQNAGTSDLQDFSESAQAGMVTKRTPAIPMPVQNQDVFEINSQGLSGTFRGYRRDVGIYTNPAVNSILAGQDLGAEIGPGAFSAATGIDIGLNMSATYTGPWLGDHALENLNFKNSNFGMQENFYFKMAGENTARELNDVPGGYGPIAFQVSMSPPTNSALDALSDVFSGENDIVVPEFVEPIHPGKGRVDSPGSADNSPNTARERRQNSVQYLTLKEKLLNLEVDDYSRTVQTIDKNGEDVFEVLGTSEDQNTFLDGLDGSVVGSDQIVEYEVLSADGSRYVYGLPVFNYEDVKVSFQVNYEDHNPLTLDPSDLDAEISTGSNPGRIGYVDEDNDYSNDKGDNNEYHLEKTPAYAHSYMLTEIYSDDYVDVTGDGPTDDDLGYYCKFNYARLADYQWRFPYTGASYSAGDYTNELDDQASFSYGRKDLCYLTSIETKTHIAIFKLSEREDGLDQSMNLNNGNVDSSDDLIPLMKLDQIALYAKSDYNATPGPPVPLKVVKFTYSYELCQEVENHDITDGGEFNGKLTLTKVEFTYQNNDKGSLTPYVFSYTTVDYATDPNLYNAQNPSYSYANVDRWGNFAGKDPNDDINQENPYTKQEFDTYTHERAAAWSLRKIKLPSGGIIDIEYESDDYAFVQNKPAMIMVPITGTSKSDESSQTGFTLSGDHRKLYFHLDPQTLESPTNTDLKNRYLDYANLVGKYIYFKTYINLNKGSTGSEYVEGWGKVESVGFDDTNDRGFVVFQNESVGTTINPLETNPVRLAAWEYMRLERSDLFENMEDNQFNGADILELVGNLLQMVPNAMQRIISFYGVAMVHGWANEIDDDVDHPSFLRLYDPDGRKLGGGSRVSKISIKDNWAEDNAIDGETEFNREYGQEFEYKLEDGTSSGVAQYEPVLGGEENACKYPIFFNQSNAPVSYRTPTSILEEPLEEAYFPSPVVGYSRVTIKNIAPDELHDFAVPGKIIYEYYTAKDFPVYTKRTNLSTSDGTMRSLFVPVFIPSVGWQVLHSQVYSQGFYIELNDMHGKPKTVSGYPSISGENSEMIAPSTTTEFYYDLNPNNPKRLNNQIPVMRNNGVISEMTVGEAHDFFTHMAEHASYSIGPGGNFNINVGSATAGLPLPTANLQMEYAQNSFRSVATTKVVYKNGILKETRNYVDGAYSRSVNEVWDPETGEPVISKTYNEWGKPIYTRNYMAHRYYEGMNGAYKNYRATYYDCSVTTGTITFGEPWNLVNPSNVFFDGDELLLWDGANYQTTYFYDDKLWDEEGTEIDGITGCLLTVVRSGRRNLQATAAGSISHMGSALNAVDVLLQAWNEAIQEGLETSPISPGVSLSGTFPVNCSSPIVNADWAIDNNELTITVPDCGSISIEFPGTVDLPDSDDLILEISNTNGSVEFEFFDCNVHDGCTLPGEDFEPGEGTSWPLESQDVVISSTSIGTSGNLSCLDDCLNVLEASAVTYKDNWTYNYSDVGIADNSGEDDVDIAASETNPYRYGKSGVWRPYRTYAYQQNRVRGAEEATQINKDGIFEQFEQFDWVAEKNETDNDEPGDAANENWIWTSEATKYSPFGFGLEEKNALNIYSSQLYGYDNSVAVATANNSSYQEIAFSSFETGIDGHLNFDGAALSSSLFAHSGKKSLEIEPGSSNSCTFSITSTDHFIPAPDRSYVISAWLYTGDGSDPCIEVKAIPSVGPDEFITVCADDANTLEIDGWTRVELIVPVQTSYEYKLYFESTEEYVYVDDLRIHPFDASFESYVYDPVTLKLRATLDNNNYATFYIYDEEGKLVQKRVETERGIQTILNSRYNTARRP